MRPAVILSFVPCDNRSPRRATANFAGAITAFAIFWSTQALAAEAAANTIKDCADCPEMIVVPAGEFVMGDTSESGSASESPAHKVAIERRFAVSPRKITFGDWKRCALAGLCRGQRGGNFLTMNRPVVLVSWVDVQQYLAWLTIQSGIEFRLLNEAEWEYLARRGLGARIADAHEGPSDLSNPREPGLEWISDCWHDDYVGGPATAVSWDSGGDCRYHVVRGSRPGARTASPSKRYRFLFKATDPLVGFRVARTISD